MWPLDQPGNAAAPPALEKPFSWGEWAQYGATTPGVDVVQLGTEPHSAAAVWTKQPIGLAEWTLEATLRVFKGSGESERSGVAVWLTDRPLAPGPVHGSEDNWDGLAVMMDSLGWDDHGTESGSRGAVRGHLNDGTISFESADRASEQAFSLCRVAYRETGANALNLRVGYGSGALVVELNGQMCFMTDKVQIPSGYFGISADTDSSGDVFAFDRLNVQPGIAPELLAWLRPEISAAAERKDTTTEAGPVDKAPSGEKAVAADSLAQGVIRDINSRVDSILTRIGALEHVQANSANSAGTEDPALRQELDRLRELVGSLDARLARAENKLGDLSARDEDHLTGDVQGLKSQLATLANQVGERGPVDNLQVSDSLTSPGPSLVLVIVVAVLAQVVFQICYTAYRSRKRRHEKLL